MRLSVAVVRRSAQVIALCVLAACGARGPATRASDLVDLRRADWGAAPPVGEMVEHTPERITIHHTASRRDPGRTTVEKLRALQRFSQTESPLADGRMKAPWPDVPYHYYIAEDGTVAEARDSRYAGDSNTPYDPSGHLLIVVEGNFEEESPSAAQMRSLERLVTALAERWGIPGERVASHRDFASTACPGDSLYSELPRLRRLIDGPGDVGLRAVVISDLNESYGTVGYSTEVRAMVDRIVGEWRPDVVVIAGDLIAGQQPELADATVRAMWREFDSVVAEPLRAAGIPLIATLGNHDASAYPAHARDRRLAVEHWTGRPGRVPAGAIDTTFFPLRYTSLVRNVFFAVWDGTSQESSRDLSLLDWLDGALRSPEARSAEHRVVVSHLPLYPVAEGRARPGEFLVQGDSLRRALEALGATLFVSGHHHAYFPGRRGGLLLLHSGALGSGPRPLLTGEPPRKSVAALEFPSGAPRVTGYEVAAGGEVRPIPIETLPTAICSDAGWVARWDVADAGDPCPVPPR